MPPFLIFQSNMKLDSFSGGRSVQFNAFGVYTDDSTENMTSSAYWESSDVNVATMEENPGLAQTVGEGVTTITATVGGPAVVSTTGSVWGRFA